MPTELDKSLLVHGENALVEQPSIELFGTLGWQTAACFDEFAHGPSPLGRRSKGEVVLVQRLRRALERLNPDLPGEALELAIEELVRDRSVMTPAAANREIYDMLKKGVRVVLRGEPHPGTAAYQRVLQRPDAGDLGRGVGRSR